MTKKYRLYLKLLNRLQKYAQSYKLNANKNFKRYFRQRKDEKRNEEKKIVSMFTGLVARKKQVMKGVASQMISTLKSTITSGKRQNEPPTIGAKIHKKLDDTLSTIGDKENIRDSFKDILSGNFKINNIKRTKK